MRAAGLCLSVLHRESTVLDYSYTHTHTAQHSDERTIYLDQQGVCLVRQAAGSSLMSLFEQNLHVLPETNQFSTPQQNVGRIGTKSNRVRVRMLGCVYPVNPGF